MYGMMMMTGVIMCSLQPCPLLDHSFKTCKSYPAMDNFQALALRGTRRLLNWSDW